MEFRDKFKLGDVICSNAFYNGKLMVVQKFSEAFSPFHGSCYVCDDMFIDNQGWCAYEHKDYIGEKIEYDWRLATDHDYLRNLENWMDIKYTLSNHTECVISNNGIYILDGVILNPQEAIELRDIINKHVGVHETINLPKN